MDTTTLIIVIVVLVLLFGGGGYGRRANWRGPQYGGLLGVILIILLLLWLTGNLGPGRLGPRVHAASVMDVHT
jgi:hypothetical protein